MAHPESFRRARRPEQKEQRRAAILEAAARLAAAKGVRSVNLGDISLSVGLSRSNVLRYFGTREEIYLQLAAERYQDWAGRVTARLGRSAVVAPTEIAVVVADCLAQDTLLCDLIGEGASALEYNVSQDAVRAYKRTTFGVLDDLADVLVERCVPLGRQQAGEVLAAVIALTAGMWPWSNPAPVVAELFRTDPDLARHQLPFGPALTRLLEAVVLGLAAQAGSPEEPSRG